MPTQPSPEALEVERGIIDVAPEPQAKEAPEPRFEVLSAVDFLRMPIPERGMLLAPWLPEKGMCMLYAPRGVGKTWVALGISHAVATGGSFLGWRAPEARSVLYIDGEMAGHDLQERLAGIAGDSDLRNLRLAVNDLADSSFPKLATPEGRRALLDAVGDASLIVIDNIATLAGLSRANEEDSWAPLNELALELRRRGVAVLFIHHAGKGGDQRGTSAKEDSCDTVIRLTRPEDYDASQGARFTVTFTKARKFHGADAEPFEAQLDPETNTWVRTGVRVNQLTEKILALHAEELSQHKIAEKLGISASTVNKHLRKSFAAAEDDRHDR